MGYVRDGIMAFYKKTRISLTNHLLLYSKKGSRSGRNDVRGVRRGLF